MTVGFYSPLPPAPTGVADYSVALLPKLQENGRVTVSPDTCDIAIYHIGNNRLHKSIYKHALKQPGIVVLHDALLHHFYLGSFQQAQYLDEFVYNYGEWHRNEAASLWNSRSASAQDFRYFERPMLKRIALSSLAVIVHNPAAAQAVRQHSPATPVTEIPHFCQPVPPPPPETITRFRHQLGIPANTFVFAVFGYLRETKRLLAILQAFAKLRQVTQNTHLLVAGGFVSQDLQRAVSPLLNQPRVHYLPHLPEPQFQSAIASADCCINLRYPTAGETSGIAIRLMGAGKPVIVTDGEEWLRFPQTALFRIPAGPPESAALFEAMATLSDNPEIAREMGRQAAEHIQRYHSLSASGTAYWKLLCSVYESQS